MAFTNTLWSALLFLFSLFTAWLGIFAAPFLNPSLLWIIVPIYLSWIFTDFFQERRGTSLGNAITNGVVVLWVSIDWTRTIISLLQSFSWSVVVKFLLVLLAFLYGLMIMIEGIRGRDFVTRFGRVRETSYVLLMFTPIIYGVTELDWRVVLSIIVFFPVFYYLMELVDRKLLPAWGITKIEEEEKQIEQGWR